MPREEGHRFGTASYGFNLRSILPEALGALTEAKPEDPVDHLSQWLRRSRESRFGRGDKHHMLTRTDSVASEMERVRQESNIHIEGMRRNIDNIQEILQPERNKKTTHSQQPSLSEMISQFQKRRQDVYEKEVVEMIREGRVKPLPVRIVQHPKLKPIFNMPRGLVMKDKIVDSEGKRLVDKKGRYVDKTGRLVTETVRYYDSIGRLCDAEGRFTDVFGRFVNDNGQLVDVDGRLVDEMGRLVDEHNRTVDQDGRLRDGIGRLVDKCLRLIDDEGRLIDYMGRLIDAHDRLVDEEGRLVNMNKQLISVSGKLTNDSGRYIDEFGRLLDIQGRLIDDKGRLIDSFGNLIDPYGRHVDEEGRFLDGNRNLVDIFGRPIDADGKLIDRLGRHINAEGRLVDEEGNIITIHGRVLGSTEKIIDNNLFVVDGHGRIIDSQGRKRWSITTPDGLRSLTSLGTLSGIDEKGRPVDSLGRHSNSQGNLINDEGDVIDNEGRLCDIYGRLIDRQGHFVNIEGQRVNEEGRLLNDHGMVVDDCGRLIDGESRLIDDNGSLIDELGRRIDNSGRLIDEFDRVVDAEGRPITIDLGLLLNDKDELRNANHDVVDIHGRVVAPAPSTADVSQEGSRAPALLKTCHGVQAFAHYVDSDGLFVDKTEEVVNPTIHDLVQFAGDLELHTRFDAIGQAQSRLNNGPPGLQLDSEGRLLNHEGRLLDLSGHPVDEQGRYVDIFGHLVDDIGRLIDEKGRLVNDQRGSSLESERGRLMDEEGRLLDEKNRLVCENARLLDDKGRLVDEKDRLIDERGRLIDERGTLVDERGRLIDEKGRLVDEKDRLIDERGRLIDERGRVIDEKGRLVDQRGRLIDERGRLIDEKGRLVDRLGRRVDDKGRLLDRQGSLQGSPYGSSRSSVDGRCSYVTGIKTAVSSTMSIPDIQKIKNVEDSGGRYISTFIDVSGGVPLPLPIQDKEGPCDSTCSLVDDRGYYIDDAKDLEDDEENKLKRLILGANSSRISLEGEPILEDIQENEEGSEKNRTSETHISTEFGTYMRARRDSIRHLTEEEMDLQKNDDALKHLGVLRDTINAYNAFKKKEAKLHEMQLPGENRGNHPAYAGPGHRLKFEHEQLGTLGGAVDRGIDGVLTKADKHSQKFCCENAYHPELYTVCDPEANPIDYKARNLQPMTLDDYGLRETKV